MALLAERHARDDHALLYGSAGLKKVRLTHFSPEIGAWERRHLSERQGCPASV